MGLLDTLGSDDVLGGLLSAGAASGAKGNFLARMAAGLQAGDRFSQGRQEQARKRSQEERDAEWRQLQILKMQRDEQQAAAAQAQAGVNTDALRSALLPTSGIDALAGGGGPTLANATKIGQPKQLDIRQFMAKNPGVDLAGIQQFMALEKSLRPEKAEFSTAPQYDQNGRAFILSKDGQIKYLDGVKARDELVSEDLGGKKGFRTKYSPDMLGMADKFQTPDSIASNETSRRGQDITARGQNMADARAREFNSISGGAKAPAGYRFKADGSLEAIPGGPADIKAGELGAKADARRQSQAAQATSVLETIGDAKSLVGNTTAGFGAFAANLPATDARNLSAKLETIKANLGFDRLQQMREQSPTGGALGAVAVQELTALQSTVASLDQKQSPAQLKASLDRIEKHYKRWQDVVQQSGAQSSGGASGGWGGVVDFGSLK